MTHLLDTNICIAYLNGRDAAVRDRLLALQPSDVLLCSVVKAELLFGARKSARVEDNLLRLTDFFQPFASLAFDDQAADRYGVIRAQLEREGQLVGSNDLMIAAISLAHDVTLVTRNQPEFRRIPGLRIAVW